MAVTAQQSISPPYTGDGTTATFVVPFYFAASSHLVVEIDNVVQSLGTYTVSGAGVESGGSITFVSGYIPTSGKIIVIRRSVPLSRADNYEPNGPLPENVHELDHDNPWRAIQDIAYLISQSVKAPNAERQNLVLPSVSARQGKLFGFDSAGLPIAVTNDAGTSTVTVAGSTTARAIAAHLGDNPTILAFGGATGGATDNTAACNAMLAAGESLVFTEGDFLINSKITITDQSVAIIGRGHGETRLLFNGTTGGFEFNDTQTSSTSYKVLVIRDLTISTNKTGFQAIKGTWKPVPFSFASCCRIEGVRIETADLNNTGQYWGGGILLNDAKQSFISDVTLINALNTLNGYAISLTGQCLANTIKGCTASYWDRHISITGSAVRELTYTVASGSFVDGDTVQSSSGGIGVMLKASSPAQVAVISGAFALGVTLTNLTRAGVSNATTVAADKTRMSEGFYISGGEAVYVNHGVIVDAAANSLNLCPAVYIDHYHANAIVAGIELKYCADVSVDDTLVFARLSTTTGIIFRGVANFHIGSGVVVNGIESGSTTAKGVRLENFTASPGAQSCDTGTVTPMLLALATGVDSDGNHNNVYVNARQNVVTNKYVNIHFNESYQLTSGSNKLMRQRMGFGADAWTFDYYHTGFSPAGSLNISDDKNGLVRLTLTQAATAAAGLATFNSALSVLFKVFLNTAQIGNYANDAAAAAGGVVVGEVYRNGSDLQIRVV